MRRTKHPKKDVEEALVHAESQGWLVKQGGSHAWGKLYCPYNDDQCRCGEFCIVSIWSTPRNASHHAAQLRRVIDNCLRQCKKEGVGKIHAELVLKQSDQP